jgi:hypothetical protein
MILNVQMYHRMYFPEPNKWHGYVRPYVPWFKYERHYYIYWLTAVNETRYEYLITGRPTL